MTIEGRKDLDDLIAAEVFTSDGERLGKVQEVQDASFKIDAPFKPDYWLSFSTVGSINADRILLTFPKEQLGQYKSDEPVAA